MKLLDTVTVVFIILKMLNLIDWSWWVVLSPSWVAVILYLMLLGLGTVLKNNKK